MAPFHAAAAVVVATEVLGLLVVAEGVDMMGRERAAMVQ
jgi:hypothetical protein